MPLNITELKIFMFPIKLNYNLDEWNYSNWNGFFPHQQLVWSSILFKDQRIFWIFFLWSIFILFSFVKIDFKNKKKVNNYKPEKFSFPLREFPCLNPYLSTIFLLIFLFQIILAKNDSRSIFQSLLHWTEPYPIIFFNYLTFSEQNHTKYLLNSSLWC
jgi:hypothetical protein